MENKIDEYEIRDNWIIRETTDVNGHLKTQFVTIGGKFDCIEDALKEVYVDQGGLYLRVFKVDPHDAKLAEWHPEGATFNSNCCGWTRFLKSGGKTEKQITRVRVDVEQLIKNDTFWGSE